MKLNNPMRITAVAPLLIIGVYLLCGCGGSEVIGSRGGSEVVGKLVTENSVPVAGAIVAVVTVDSIDNEGRPVRFDTVKVAVSDNEGRFVFDTLPEGKYYLFARQNEDSLILIPFSFSPDPKKRLDLGTLVMKQTGAISGIVVPVKGATRRVILVYIAGTSFMATVDIESGKFRISGVPPDTSYEVRVACDGYVSVSIPDVFVKAGKETFLSDTISLKLDPSGRPQVAPEGLKVEYDTGCGMALLTWQPVPIDDVERYVVYYSIDSGMSWKTEIVYGTEATIEVFYGLDESDRLMVLFQVAAYDNDNMEGDKGETDTLYAIPPSWLRVDIALEKIEFGSASLDTAYIAVSFSGRIRSVEKIIWWVDHPDSVIRSINVDNVFSGADTLRWIPSTAVKRLYVSVVDNAALTWIDSLDAMTLLPSDRWQLSDSLLQERRYAGACALNNKIYVFGGGMEKESMSGEVSLTGIKTAEVYDASTHRWSRIASMNYARMKAACAVADGKIYVFGGTSGKNNYATVERYDPSIDRWDIVDTMPRSVVGAAACAVDGLIYLTGGVTGTVEEAILLKDILTYDPINRKWGKAANELSIARQMHQTVAIGGCIVVIGGISYDNLEEEMIPLNSIECLSASSDGSSCAQIPTYLLSPRFGFCTAFSRGKLIIIGGRVNAQVDEKPVAAVEVISVDGGSPLAAAATPMPAARDGCAAVELNGRIYVIGGSESGAGAQKSTRAVYVYYP